MYADRLIDALRAEGPGWRVPHLVEAASKLYGLGYDSAQSFRIINAAGPRNVIGKDFILSSLSHQRAVSARQPWAW